MKTPDGKEFDGTVEEIMSILNIRYRLPTTVDEEQPQSFIKKIGQSNEERLTKQREYNRTYRAKQKNPKVKRFQTNYQEKIGIPLCRYAIKISKQTGITTPNQLADEMKSDLEKKGVSITGYKTRRKLVQACYIGMKLMKKDEPHLPLDMFDETKTIAVQPVTSTTIAKGEKVA